MKIFAALTVFVVDFKALFSKEEDNPGARVTVRLPWEDMSACLQIRWFVFKHVTSLIT